MARVWYSNRLVNKLASVNNCAMSKKFLITKFDFSIKIYGRHLQYVNNFVGLLAPHFFLQTLPGSISVSPPCHPHQTPPHPHRPASPKLLQWWRQGGRSYCHPHVQTCGKSWHWRLEGQFHPCWLHCVELFRCQPWCQYRIEIPSTYQYFLEAKTILCDTEIVNIGFNMKTAYIAHVLFRDVLYRLVKTEV